jgi:succinyl-diaminopimelate desuccinylase
MTVKGIQGHIAYPHLARNPIHEAAPVIAELVSTVWDEGNEHFPPTSFQISNIQGGTGAFNIIPGSVDIFFNFRFSTASTVESLKAGVVAALTRHRVEYELEWTLGGLPFLTPRGRLVDALSNAIHRVAGVTPMLSTGGGTSDGRFIATICDEVAEFGPLNATIHKLNEHVDVADIDRTHEIYFHTIEALLLGRE